MSDARAEAARIEQLWSGEFGTEYLARNPAGTDVRRPFWELLLGKYPVASVLEVGCNLGLNLRPIRAVAPKARVSGIDVNALALATLRRECPGVHLARAAARSLPFADRSHEFVFTVGVLIHQPPEVLADVLREVVRCASRYVFCAEYFAPDWTEVPYRGQERALFKGDFGGEYRRLFPRLRLVQTGFLSRAEGWGDVTWWIFER